MTIDTSREAVERLSKAARSAEYRQFPHGVFADTFDALAAERDAALAEVARLSTPPDDAEVINLTGEAYSMSMQAAMPLWQDVSRLIDTMADALTRQAHALAAETAKREAMEAELAACVEATTAAILGAWRTCAGVKRAEYERGVQDAVEVIDERLEGISTYGEWAQGWITGVNGARKGILALLTQEGR